MTENRAYGKHQQIEFLYIVKTLQDRSDVFKSMIEVEIKICQSLLGAVLGIVSKLSGQAL